MYSLFVNCSFKYFPPEVAHVMQWKKHKSNILNKTKSIDKFINQFENKQSYQTRKSSSFVPLLNCDLSIRKQMLKNP